MNDAANIFNLYLETTEKVAPQMTVDENGNKQWYLHGKLHREDGPAYEGIDGTKSWYLHGKRHRENAPAVEDINGSKYWFLHGKLHREDGAAIEFIDGTKSWYLHGKRHREDGAAIEHPDGSKEWWLRGKSYASAKQWAEMLLKQRNKPHDADAINDFLATILDKYIA